MDSTSEMFRHLIRNIENCHVVNYVDSGRVLLSSFEFGDNTPIRVVKDRVSGKVIIYHGSSMVTYNEESE